MKANANIEKLVDVLEDLNSRGVAFAAKDTLNQTASKVHGFARSNVSDEFVNRNAWSVRSVVYNRAQGNDVNRMVASVGSVQQYMADQETGFTIRSQGKHGVPIPMGSAAGQHGQKRRTRRIKKQFYKSQMHLGKRHKNTVVAVREAIENKQRIIFHEFGDIEGMWQIVGGRLGKRGRGWPKGAKIRLLYAMDDKSVRVPQTKWLEPAADRGVKIMPAIHVKNLKSQIDRAARMKGLR